jgi:hypothetical protein
LNTTYVLIDRLCSSSGIVVVVLVVFEKMFTGLPIPFKTAVNKATGEHLYITGNANANCIMVFSSERIEYESSA